MLSASIFLFAMIASSPIQDAPVLRASTVKSLNEFGSCFTRAQDGAARAWAFVPTESGGTFTNAGANGVTNPYWLRVSEARPLSEIRLFAAQSSADAPEVMEAVNRCR